MGPGEGDPDRAHGEDEARDGRRPSAGGQLLEPSRRDQQRGPLAETDRPDLGRGSQEAPEEDDRGRHAAGQ
eukprot:6617399-Pyramimonas_sp.AAC.1